AIRHEAESGTAHSRLLAEQGLSAGINLVATNPGAFDNALATGNALIDALTLPANVREELQRNHLDALTRSAFEARISGARTPQKIDGVMADLGQQTWRERAKVATYDHLLDIGRTFRRTLISGRDAQARAAVDSVDERMKATGANRATIDPAEIASVDSI